MQANTFFSATKEVILSILAALFLFTFVAGQSAEAAESTAETLNKEALQTAKFSEQEQLVKRIALVMHLEQDLVKSKVLLAEIEKEFEKEQIHAESLFTATLKVYQIEESLENAKFNLMLALNKVANTESPALLASK